MLFIFLIEDPPSWVILMTSKLDLWLRAADFLRTPLSSRRQILTLITWLYTGWIASPCIFFMLCFQFGVEFFQVEFCGLYLFLYSDSIFLF